MSDRVLEAWASRFIDRAKQRSEPWQGSKPGRKLKLLIAGYNGAKNIHNLDPTKPSHAIRVEFKHGFPNPQG
jgi:hypothetical protein